MQLKKAIQQKYTDTDFRENNILNKLKTSVSYDEESYNNINQVFGG